MQSAEEFKTKEKQKLTKIKTINCNINIIFYYYQPSSIDSIRRHVKCEPSKSTCTSLVDQRAVDCKSSPTGSVFGSAHDVILWEMLTGVDQFQDLAGKGMQSNHGFSWRGVQLSYGRPFWKKYKDNSQNLLFMGKHAFWTASFQCLTKSLSLIGGLLLWVGPCNS